MVVLHPVVSVRRDRAEPAVVRVHRQRTDCRDDAGGEERTADRDWNQIRVVAVELRHSRVEESVFGRTFEPQLGHYWESGRLCRRTTDAASADSRASVDSRGSDWALEVDNEADRPDRPRLRIVLGKEAVVTLLLFLY